jgi:ADP-ribosyl-[dinitrogen reductase] hydrolase
MVKDGIIGFVVGDALGVPVEFITRQKLNKDPVINMREFGVHNVPKGAWSDDTSMVIATIDSIIKSNGINYNDMGNKFCDWAERNNYTATGQVFDIGTTTWDSLMRYSEGNKNAIECGADSFYENGNGSLMRMLPLAYYLNKSKKDVFKVVKEASSITHAHEVSVLGCYIYTRFAMYLIKKVPKDIAYMLIKRIDYESMFSKEAIEHYKRILVDDIRLLDTQFLSSTGYVVHTLESVMYSILCNYGYKECVTFAVNLGGDTDTIAALTGGLAGIHHGYDDIPRSWIQDVLRVKYLLDMSNAFESCLNNL